MEFEAIQQFLNEEDEDYDNYFLQPTQYPYNMTEKIAAANKLLNNNEYNGFLERNAKVKFRENLVDYEPDHTSDDGTEEHSIYEKHSGVNETIYENVVTDLDVQLQDKLHLGIANSDDEILEEIFDDDDDTIIIEEPQLAETQNRYFQDEDDDAIYIEEETQITESHNEYIEDEDTEINFDILDVPNTIDEYIATEINLGEQKKENINPDAETVKKRKNKPKNERKTLKLKETNIICKNQCLEKLNDFSRFKLFNDNQHKKPPVAPVLKLKRRKCCDLNLKSKLPEYTGLRSEYGMNPEQLEKREKLKASSQKRELLRKQKLQQLKNDRQQQNEEFFCDWLKEIAIRKELEQKKHRKCTSPYASPKSKTVSGCGVAKTKQRPNTANDVYDIEKQAKPNKMHKRPHTSIACVFIEVPKKCLQKGIQIGDLLVTTRSPVTKKLHLSVAT